MSLLSVKHLFGLDYIPKEDIDTILDTAIKFREVLDRPIKKVPSLNGKNILNLFFENSTRTKVSFELAAKRLSADVVSFATSSSSLKKGESLRLSIAGSAWPAIGINPGQDNIPCGAPGIDCEVITICFQLAGSNLQISPLIN